MIPFGSCLTACGVDDSSATVSPALLATIAGSSGGDALSDGAGAGSGLAAASGDVTVSDAVGIGIGSVA